MRRVATRGPLRVPVAHVLKHLERWGVLARDVDVHDMAPVVIYALQPTTDPHRCVFAARAAAHADACVPALQPHTHRRLWHRFVLHGQPLALDYDQFDKLLLGLAVLQTRIRKRSAADGVELTLGETLNALYRKSGVLLSLPAAAVE